MRDSSFDKYINQKINNHSSAVPEDMWQRIVQEREGKRRWMIGWWSSVLLGSILLVTVFGGIQIANKLSGVKQYNSTSNSNENVSGNGLSSIKTSDQKTSKPVQENGLQADDEAANTNHPELKIIPASPSTQLMAAANTPNSLKMTDDLSTDKAVPVSNNLFQNYKAAIPTKGKKETKISSKDGLSNDKFSSMISSKNNSESAGLFQLKYPWRPSYYALHEETSFSNGKTMSLKPVSDLHLPKIDCPSSGDPMLRDFNVEIYGSPDLVMKSTSVGKSSNAYYLAKKDSSETKLASFTFGVRVSKSIGENMVFKTGVQYSQINQKFTYKNENERKLTTVITSRIIVRSPGDTVIVKDTSVTEMIGYSVRTSFNRLSSIDIPILLGYEWSFNNWKIGLNAGPIINISSWQEGETLDTNFLPMSFGKNKATVYKKNMGLGFYSGLSIIKCIGERTSLFAEPYFRYNLSSFTNSSSLVTEKYKVAGILLGVRYNLSKAKATH